MEQIEWLTFLRIIRIFKNIKGLLFRFENSNHHYSQKFVRAMFSQQLPRKEK